MRAKFLPVVRGNRPMRCSQPVTSVRCVALCEAVQARAAFLPYSAHRLCRYATDRTSVVLPRTPRGACQRRPTVHGCRAPNGSRRWRTPCRRGPHSSAGPSWDRRARPGDARRNVPEIVVGPCASSSGHLEAPGGVRFTRQVAASLLGRSVRPVRTGGTVAPGRASCSGISPKKGCCPSKP